ncbi:MAG TPA: hypothetical protein QGF95_07680 [Candidatus Latescibacteria bacterium]|jgi:hypothetical protein|nr:hypothetical protein [Gemmatimonadaceae bacterium]MDP6016506.1 hypothetical protein [Candidatus Latescibacterota bacterium]HJP30418.1 hypothetical protein [Candidatus Latescibacterota bacterium]
MRRLTLRLDLLLLCFLLTAATTVTAQIRDLTTLQERRVLLGKSSDSLMSVCIRLVASKDSLSALAESLWSQDPESAELLLTRSASRVLVARLQVVERRLDSLATASDSLEADLRDSYDWEISRLHGLLTEEGWDEGLFRQLLVFQEEREALGNAIRSDHHRLDGDSELSISAADGPEELRQKIEYAQDRVAAYQSVQRQIARRLRFIERQVLVMQKFWHLAEQMDRLHEADGDLMRRRALERLSGPGVEITRPEGNTESSIAMRGARSLAPAKADSTVEPFEAPWLLESQRLKARSQELREVEAVLQERIAVFQEHLSRILEGGE